MNGPIVPPSSTSKKRLLKIYLLLQYLQVTTIVKMQNFYIFFGLINFLALFSSINSEISDNKISKGYDQEIHQTPEENTPRQAKGRQTYSKQIKVRNSH